MRVDDEREVELGAGLRVMRLSDEREAVAAKLVGMRWSRQRRQRPSLTLRGLIPII
jgi:hypothetical protein